MGITQQQRTCCKNGTPLSRVMSLYSTHSLSSPGTVSAGTAQHVPRSSTLPGYTRARDSVRV